MCVTPPAGRGVQKSGSFYYDGTRESVVAFYGTAFPTLIRAVALSADLSDEGVRTWPPLCCKQIVLHTDCAACAAAAVRSA